MKTFKKHSLDITELEKEIEDFENLLTQNKELDENNDVLPFFRKRNHLSLFIGNYFPNLGLPNCLSYEFSVLNDFKADIAVGNKRKSVFCFIELEDAKENSVFVKKGKKFTSEWATRFEKGYSQIIDWFWKIEGHQGDKEFIDIFDSREITYTGMLIIGRDNFLNTTERDRLSWRHDKVQVNSNQVICLTYDELLADFKEKLELFKHFKVNST